MNALAAIKAQPDTNWYALYLEERERNRNLHNLLADACMVLGNEADWRDRHGRDGDTLRGIVSRVKREALS